MKNMIDADVEARLLQQVLLFPQKAHTRHMKTLFQRPSIFRFSCLSLPSPVQTPKFLSRGTTCISKQTDSVQRRSQTKSLLPFFHYNLIHKNLFSRVPCTRDLKRKKSFCDFQSEGDKENSAIQLCSSISEKCSKLLQYCGLKQQK